MKKIAHKVDKKGFKIHIYFCSNIFITYLASLLFRPLLRGKEIYTQIGFFVQSILADRHIHRRELRLVSLESLSSAEYGIKKIFFNFRFLQGVIEV